MSSPYADLDQMLPRFALDLLRETLIERNRNELLREQLVPRLRELLNRADNGGGDMYHKWAMLSGFATSLRDSDNGAVEDMFGFMTLMALGHLDDAA